MLKIKIKATGQIIEVKDFSRIIIDEENEESGKQPMKNEWYWCSTRKANKRIFTLDWLDGRYDYNYQDNYNWVRPVSNMKIR